MKRLFTRWILVLALASFTGTGAALEAGRDYQRLPAAQEVETGDKIEVREFFWYGCPHCYSLEPAIERWLKQKPANVEFVRTPATAPRWLPHARAFYAFAALGATDKTHAALFQAIHQQKRRLETEAALAEFAKEQGIDPAAFRREFNSFGVNTSVARAGQINAAYGVTSVPTFAVDGKYVTSPSMVGSEAAFLGVLDQLVQQAARERQAAAKRSAK